MRSEMIVDAVRIADGADVLEGDLHIPENASGTVIFAHGSGSSRFSTRNRQVAEFLQDGGFATLLLDLLTREEEKVDVRTAQFRFDIPRLARRMVAATDWAMGHVMLGQLPIGYFGASTGAAAALIAAAERAEVVAVVSRGGRPDLAGDALPIVRSPTLLIVGENDQPVIELNQDAMRRMHAPVRLAIVPHATHLFEEPDTLEEVERLALDWFGQYLRR